MASNLIGRLRVPLQTEGDRQFYTRVLLAQLGELAVGELAPVDEIAERTVGELNPIRTAGKPRRSGVLGNPEIGDAIRAGKEITGIALVFEAAATASGWRAGLRRWNKRSGDPWLECCGSRVHRRAKTDRLDTESLNRGASSTAVRRRS
jgi:hypothetical protein